MTNRLKNLFWIFALTIFPLFIFSVSWTIENNFPFGNHDSTFHYARAIGDKSFFENIFGQTDGNYYSRYPPLTNFVFQVFIYALFFIPPVLAFNIAAFAVLIGVLWAFHYYTGSDRATFLLATSSFLVGYFSTTARMILVIMLLFYLLKDKLRVSIGLLSILAHKYALPFIFASWFFEPLFKGIRKLIPAISLLALTFISFTRQQDLAFFPFLLFGTFFLDKYLSDQELSFFCLSLLGFLFFDPTISMIMCLFLAMSLGRYLDEWKLSPAIEKTVAAIILLSFYLHLLLIALAFQQTDPATMGLIFQKIVAP